MSPVSPLPLQGKDADLACCSAFQEVAQFHRRGRRTSFAVAKISWKEDKAYIHFHG